MQLSAYILILGRPLTHGCGLQRCLPNHRTCGWVEWAYHLHPSLFQYADAFSYIVTFLISSISIDVLDGAMVVLAMYTLNILHPGILLVNRSDTAYDQPLDNKSSSNIMLMDRMT
jgi:hypothetical protein